MLSSGEPRKATLDRIAETAGVHRSTVFRHFPGGRSEVLLAVYARVSAAYLSRLIRHLRKQPTLTEAMVEGLVHTVERTLENPMIAPLFAADARSRLSDLEPASRMLNGLVREAWGPLLSEAQGRGDARADLTLETLSEFMLRAVFSMLSLPPPVPRPREETKAFLRQVIEPFVTGGTRPAAVIPALRRPSAPRPRPERPPSEDGEGSVAERLTDTAAALFVEKGFARSSTRELAERLQISQPSLYHHVGSKQDLLERVCLESIARLDREVRARLAGTDAAVNAVIAGHIHILTRDRNLQLARIFEQEALDPDASARVSDAENAYASLIASVIATEQATGRIRADVPAGHQTEALLNMLNWSVFGIDPSDRRAERESVAGFVELFLNGAASR